MNAKEMTKENVEPVLLEFRLEASKPDPTILEAYCRRYPQFARELTDYALDWLVDEATGKSSPASDSNASSPIVSRAISRLYDRIREREAANEIAVSPQRQHVENLFGGLSVVRKRAICDALGINMPLFAKLQNRLVDATSVPCAFLQRLADELQGTPEGLLNYLNLPAMMNPRGEFKAQGKPFVSGKKERFEDAVRASSIDDKRKQELLQE
jgi:hypothetical protein